MSQGNLNEMMSTVGWLEFCTISEEEFFRLLDTMIELDPTNPAMPETFAYLKGRIDAIVAMWKFEREVKEKGLGDKDKEAVERKFTEKVRSLYRRLFYK